MLELHDVSQTYGSGASTRTAIEDITFSVAEGELVSVVGPSGAGKTTLLKIISGLMPPSVGRVSLRGQAVAGVPEDLAMVFQDYSRSLFPWKRAGANVEMPLKARGLPRSERRRRVAESLAAVGLEDAADRYPWQLSGGMQQRVAIARALACRPSLLVMDEPFASIDAQTRAELEDLVMEVREHFGQTILFVTHDIDESVYLADRVVVLSASPGRVIAEVVVDLPRPRDQIATKEHDGFVRLRGEVARLIMKRARGSSDAGRPPAPGATPDDEVTPERSGPTVYSV